MPGSPTLHAEAAPLPLPPCVAQWAARFAVGADGSVPEAPGVQVPDDLANATPKRRAEYVAGRWCATRAIRALDPSFDGVVDREGRAPRWPAGFVGSITHADGFAWAAAARAGDALGVGIDAENAPRRDRLQALRARVVADGDSPPPPAGDEATHLALLFSAKESVFKCLHPIVGITFWYEAAAVRFDHEARAFRVTLRADLGAGFARGTTIDGVFDVAGARALTAIVLGRG
jgi:enterobactin synthetase component D